MHHLATQWPYPGCVCPRKLQAMARRTKILIVPGIACLLAAALAAPASDAAAKKVTFRAPVQVSADETQSGAEPSIRAARDGTLYIVAPQGLGSGVRTQDNGGGDVIWRSKDGGKTWEWLGSFDNAAGGGDADLAIDSSGDLWGSGLTLANTTATYSSDDGESWCVNPVGSLDTVVDRQWIETYKDEPFAFMTTGRIGRQSVILSRLELASPPGENQPGCPVVSLTVSVSGTDSYQWPGEIAVDEKNDYVYVAYNTGGATEDDIVVTRSSLDLLTTAHAVVTTTKGDSFDSFVAVDVDSAGNVYAAWNERRPVGADGKLGLTNSYVSVSKNSGETWSKPVRVNKVPTSVFPWLVAGSKGRVAVTYYGTNSKGPSPELVVQEGNPVPQWRVYASYSLNASSANPKYQEVVATPTPMHEGNVCTSGTGCATGTRDLLDYLQLDLDPCGRIVIAYTDNSRDVVDDAGIRSTNAPEFISFVGQKGGPHFYKNPLSGSDC